MTYTDAERARLRAKQLEQTQPVATASVISDEMDRRLAEALRLAAYIEELLDKLGVPREPEQE